MRGSLKPSRTEPNRTGALASSADARFGCRCRFPPTTRCIQPPGSPCRNDCASASRAVGPRPPGRPTLPRFGVWLPQARSMPRPNRGRFYVVSNTPNSRFLCPVHVTKYTVGAVGPLLRPGHPQLETGVIFGFGTPIERGFADRRWTCAENAVGRSDENAPLALPWLPETNVEILGGQGRGEPAIPPRSSAHATKADGSTR